MFSNYLYYTSKISKCQDKNHYKNGFKFNKNGICFCA
nr:MAG TPA: hypothetical protein [Caudoviricetes sp.]